MTSTDTNVQTAPLPPNTAQLDDPTLQEAAGDQLNTQANDGATTGDEK